MDVVYLTPINPFKPESSSTTSRELLSQFSTCSGWRWLEVGGKWKKNLLLSKQFHENCHYKTLGLEKFSHSAEKQNYALMREGLKG